MRDMDPEAAISCNQEKLPVEALELQTSHIAADLQSVLSTRCAAVNLAEKL